MYISVLLWKPQAWQHGAQTGTWHISPVLMYSPHYQFEYFMLSVGWLGRPQESFVEKFPGQISTHIVIAQPVANLTVAQSAPAPSPRRSCPLDCAHSAPGRIPPAKLSGEMSPVYVLAVLTPAHCCLQPFKQSTYYCCMSCNSMLHALIPETNLCTHFDGTQ